ncbi:MAG: hypothetical protein LBP95_11830 [Deltaproteobacteria bacterium]|nr:hypothetical protein [Deltaproteobacteria bacterium]
MSLCDLHYHLNAFRMTGKNLSAALAGHKRSIVSSGLDFLASTEHVYKNPLDCYLHLRRVASDLKVTVIPGVEWISRENVEIIFLFDGEASLRSALAVLKTFSHSVWEVRKLGSDLGAVLVVPHPFTPGKTGAANNLGEPGFERLLDMVDYVEIHNGLSRQFDEIYLYNRLGPFFPGHDLKVRQTARLPEKYRRHDIGWSVGSDAHFPGEICFAGGHPEMTSDNWFEALKSRLHFELVDLGPPEREVCRWRRNLASLGTVFSEAMLKKRVRYFGPK